MKTQLETTAGLTVTDLFQNDSAQGRVDKIRTEALAEVFDVTTDAGRKLCISHAAKVTKTKTAVDKIGKALSDSLNVERSKVLVDRKIYNDGLTALKVEVRQPVTEWEAAEAAKAKMIEVAFANLEINSQANNFTGELFSMTVLEAKLTALEEIDLSIFGDDSRAQALIYAGKTKIKAGIQQRKDADELAELRKAKAAQDAEAERLAEVERIEAAAVEKHEAAKVADEEKEKKEIKTGTSGVGYQVGPREVERSKKAPSKMPWLDDEEKGVPTLTKIWINDAGFCGGPELRLDWSNDRHQSIDMKDKSPKSVMRAFINAANRLEDEMRNNFL